MIKYIPIHIAKCDRCGLELAQSNVTQVQFLVFVRNLKWTVGNHVLCSSCQYQKQKEEVKVERQTDIFEFIEV